MGPLTVGFPGRLRRRPANAHGVSVTAGDEANEEHHGGVVILGHALCVACTATDAEFQAPSSGIITRGHTNAPGRTSSYNLSLFKLWTEASKLLRYDKNHPGHYARVAA